MRQVILVSIILMIVLSSSVLGYGGRSQPNEFLRTHSIFGERDVYGIHDQEPNTTEVEEEPIITEPIQEPIIEQVINQTNQTEQNQSIEPKDDVVQDNTDLLLFGIMAIVIFMIFAMIIKFQMDRGI